MHLRSTLHISIISSEDTSQMQRCECPMVSLSLLILEGGAQAAENFLRQRPDFIKFQVSLFTLFNESGKILSEVQMLTATGRAGL